MFWVKCISCVLSLIMFFVARMIWEDDAEEITWKSITVTIIAVILGIVFLVLIGMTHWSVMFIPKLALYLTFCFSIIFLEESGIFNAGISITVVLFFITGCVYLYQLKPIDDPIIETSTCKILCAKDGSMMHGSIFFVYGSSSESSVYKFYYQDEDGGIKLETIPADDATLYYIKDGEDPYIKTVVTTSYYINPYETPTKRWFKKSNKTYTLYVPEGSVSNVFEFDAE